MTEGIQTFMDCPDRTNLPSTEGVCSKLYYAGWLCEVLRYSKICPRGYQ